ncbi:hypothetical protein DPEC_G00253390 [Dallia pectoralis]|uniref:Uncharacterized protein n=1 Tax=Dallia pectoralis TaxID=75939 RepID=A0ACC2FU39_DALPE|nr:hypothetical protein DPEC_G00253390 [Dallia pectoralis]
MNTALKRERISIHCSNVSVYQPNRLVVVRFEWSCTSINSCFLICHCSDEWGNGKLRKRRHSRRHLFFRGYPFCNSLVCSSRHLSRIILRPSPFFICQTV